MLKMRLRVIALIVLSLITFGSQGNVLAQETSDQYIVQFKAGVNSATEAATLERQGAKVSSVYRYAINGVSVSLSQQAVTALKRSPRVASVDKEEVATLQATSTQTTVPSWGLDRIDQRDLPNSGTFTYENLSSSTSAVTIYVFDTGLNSILNEFSGRVLPGRNFMTDKAATDTTDCNGHGTHVSGTALGTNYGVAKSAKVLPVRVLNCRGSGTATAILNGIDWVISQHDANLGELAVANMSLGFSSFYEPVDTAVKNLIADGVATAIAAGNSNIDACTVTPASADTALTVAASTSVDSRASFSNWGRCIDVFAPGEGITSLTQNGTPASWSGTSMASPHVAGVAALILAQNPSFTPAQIRARIVQNATANKISVGTLSDSINLLLYTMDRKQVVLNPGNGQASSTLYDSEGASITLPTPTRSGFSFAGWYSAPSSGNLIGLGGAIITPTSSMNLYGVWLSNSSLTVTYNGNTNTSGSAPSDSNAYTSGALVTVLGSGSLAKSGYAFAGWCTAPVTAGTSCASPNTSYQPSNTFTINSNVALYALWTQSASAPAQISPPTIDVPINSSIVVRWVEPSSGGSTITSYRLQIFRNGSLWNTVTVFPPDISWTIQALPKGKYQVSVSAVNSVGRSPESGLSNAVRI